MTTRDQPGLLQNPPGVDEIFELNGGELVATGVSLEDFMQIYAGQHCEYIEGVVIRMAPQTLAHDGETAYLRTLLEAYFELRPIGRVIGHPFVMRLPAYPNRRREPDLMVVLHSNPHPLKDTYMDGPADICIEIVSRESTSRDRGAKFEEFERGGVSEYWLLDSVRKDHTFYRRDSSGLYTAQPLNAHGDYSTPLLPSLRVHVATLWQERLPGPAAVVAAVQAMLTEEMS